MVTKFSTGIDLDDISDEFDGQGHPDEKSNFGVLAWVFCPIIDISACKGFMCIRAQNLAHGHANSAHAHARNHKICA